MESAAVKSARLIQLTELLLAHPQGLKKAEMARRLGVHRSTIGRDITELSGAEFHLPIWEDNNLVGINRDDYEMAVSLTIHESMAVHLATRLMATRMDKHNPHAAAALRKLGQALEKLAPQVSRHLLISADVMDDVAQRYDPNYLRNLEILTRAWSDGQWTRIWYTKRTNDRVFEYEFAPYFIEPYAIGQTTYVIGLRGSPGEIRTLKLERIQRAELLDKTYTIPTDFDPQEQLADAWGIWYADTEPVDVVLKFHPRVAARVKETRWHRSETVEELSDGHLLWKAAIAEPREMRPWIRGWGSDVEVLAPPELRTQVAEELRMAAEKYKE